MAGTGLGAFFLPPIVEYFTANYDWRIAYRAVGIGAMVIALPFVLALFRENKNINTDTQTDSALDVKWGFTRGEAMGSMKFWILGAVLFTTVIVIVGLLSNFEQIMIERGLERAEIARIATLLGLTVVVGRLLVGVLVDRFWAPAVAAVFFAMPIVAMLLLINVGVSAPVGIAIAICIGLAAGAELDMLAYLTGRYFGPAHYPAIFGLVYAFFTVGAGIAPPIYGAAAQAWGGYNTILTISIGLLALSIVLFLSLGRYPAHGAAGSSAQH
jgi:predicted MFS family arabinose efflux permease